jgi:hypothetical protein
MMAITPSARDAERELRTLAENFERTAAHLAGEAEGSRYLAGFMAALAQCAADARERAGHAGG